MKQVSPELLKQFEKEFERRFGFSFYDEKADFEENDKQIIEAMKRAISETIGSTEDVEVTLAKYEQYMNDLNDEYYYDDEEYYDGDKYYDDEYSYDDEYNNDDEYYYDDDYYETDEHYSDKIIGVQEVEPRKNQGDDRND